MREKKDEIMNEGMMRERERERERESLCLLPTPFQS